MIKLIKDVTFYFESGELKMDELLLINYAKANPKLFEAILLLSEKFQILEFENLPPEFISNKEIKSIVNSSLSENQILELGRLPSLKYDTEYSILVEF